MKFVYAVVFWEYMQIFGILMPITMPSIFKLFRLKLMLTHIMHCDNFLQFTNIFYANKILNNVFQE